MCIPWMLFTHRHRTRNRLESLWVETARVRERESERERCSFDLSFYSASQLWPHICACHHLHTVIVIVYAIRLACHTLHVVALTCTYTHARTHTRARTWHVAYTHSKHAAHAAHPPQAWILRLFRQTNQKGWIKASPPFSMFLCGAVAVLTVFRLTCLASHAAYRTHKPICEHALQVK